MNCTIYLLTNKINGKIYIGQTWRALERRIGKNGNGYERCTYLHNAIMKYGVENFEYSILDSSAEDQINADRLEKEYIEKYNSTDPSIGYNLMSGGKGCRHSDESKAKISASLMGHPVSDETNKKRTDTIMNKTKNQDQIILAYQSGMTIKEIKKVFNIKGNGKVYRILKHNNIPKHNNHSNWVGKTHSDETKNKMSNAASDLWSSEERKIQIMNKRIIKFEANGITSIDRENILNEYLSGKQIVKISKERNVTENLISLVLKSVNNIPSKNKIKPNNKESA